MTTYHMIIPCKALHWVGPIGVRPTKIVFGDCRAYITISDGTLHASRARHVVNIIYWWWPGKKVQGAMHECLSWCTLSTVSFLKEDSGNKNLSRKYNGWMGCIVSKKENKKEVFPAREVPLKKSTRLFGHCLFFFFGGGGLSVCQDGLRHF